MTEGTVASLPDAIRPLVFAQWLHVLASAELGTTQYGTGDNCWTFSRWPEGHEISLRVFDPLTLHYEMHSHGFRRNDVEKLAREAKRRTERGELGEPLWYHAQLGSPQPGLEAFISGDLMRILGNAIQIEGWRRLGPEVLVKFSREVTDQETPQLFAPSHNLSALLLVPGSIAGPLGHHLARHVCELVRLICTFAMSRIVEAPFEIFPADQSVSEEAWKVHGDPAVGTLARDGISLDLFDEFAPFGGWELVNKIARSLGAYEAAIRSRNPDVATILYVAGLEALITPSTTEEWRKERLTRKFVMGVQAHALQAVTDTVNHGNCAEAFGVSNRGSISRRRRRLLERIYSLRSEGVHSGPAVSLTGLMTSSASLGARTALLSEIYTSAVLDFLAAPRSMLYGHPNVDPLPNMDASGAD